GLYPLEPHPFAAGGAEEMKSVVRRTTLGAGESLDCTYYSHNARIRRAPVVEIQAVRGGIAVHYQGDSFPLSTGGARSFYSNLGPVIRCSEPAEVSIRISDEAF
ncbi:MAG: hypothetical protein AAB262_11755, partial [Elusimicrobiota bacterium]